MNILVLGGDGFIGSHFVDQAFEHNHKVTVFGRFKYDIINNLEHLRNKIQFIAGEFANREILRDALKEKDIVYHFISATKPPTSWNDPYIEIDENLKRSIQLFELAAEQKVKKIVYASSGGTIYGRQSGVINENTLPIPFSPYGICNLTIEYFLNYFREHNGIAFDIYRIGNVFGPRQAMKTPQGVVGVWIGNILKGNEITVYGDASSIRDYVYVKDVAYLMAHSLNDLNHSGTYNVSSGIGISIIKLLDIFMSSIDEPFSYKILPRREFDNASVILDSSKLLSFFPGFEFQKIETKIKDTWEYYKLKYKS